MKYPRGFTLLIASLVSGILLALGLAIYNIVSKELVLSSSGRESQFAFYAADSGIECALFWDGADAFSTSSPSATIDCGNSGTPAAVTAIDDSVVFTRSFAFSLGASASDPCTEVTVEKTDAPVTTIIRSHGYNTCVTTNPRRIERAIRVQY